MNGSDRLLSRLRSWDQEQRTNKNGYANFADGAIQQLRHQLSAMAPHKLASYDAASSAQQERTK